MLGRLPAGPARHSAIALLAGLWAVTAGLAAPEPVGPQLARLNHGLSLGFEPNRGQTDSRVDFLARGQGYTLFLSPTETVLSLLPGGRPAGLSATAPCVVRLALVNANPRARRLVSQRLAGSANYLLGADPGQWRTGLARYGRVRYQQVWPGIDLVYSGTSGRLKFDFVVAPGARPEQVRFRLAGAQRLRLEPNGDLVANLAGAEVRKPRPVIYQETPQGRRLVPGRYVMLGGDLVGFRLGRYDRRQPLVIDPTISFSTFLGSTGTDQALSAAADSAGNLYIAGTTTSTTFPTTAPLQGTNGGGTSDGFVVKVGPNHTVIYATYFGGSGADTAMGVAALNGEAIVCGETASTNFPRQLALQPTLAGGTDAFVSRLASDGRSLVYSTYLGGTATDRLKGIAVDSNGDAYFAGMSNSANFPVANPLQPVLAGNIDGVLVKLDSTGQNLVYATYLGGAAQDDLSGVTINSNGELFATGTTSSADFPTLGAQQAANGGLDDAVVLGLNSGGSALLFSTYLGGSAKEVGGHAPALDPLGNLYVVGATGSTDFPVTSGAAQTTYGGGSADGFVACYTGGGTVLLYATYIGGSADDRLLAVAADAAGQATFGGSTASTDLSTVAPLQAATGGGLDFMLGRLNTAGNTTQFLTYLGGSGTDQFYHGVADANARWHFAGYSASPNFPLISPIQGAKSTGDDAVFGVVGGFGQQADLQIAAEGSAAVGNDIYNNDGANQTANGNTVVNYRASFTVTLQNDGGIDDVFSVTGPASSGGWTIAYFVPGSPRTDITSEVTTTGYQVAIGAGGQQSLTLEMTPSNAVAEGDSQTVLVTGQSVADASMLDAVGATATVVGPPRLDYTGEPGYEADGVEPDSGTVNSTYVFRATYINPRGAAATGVQLHVRRNGTEIAGSPVAMTSLSGQPLTGVTYQAQVDRSILTGLVKEGTYDYYLTATDGVTAASGPLSVSNAGPIVNNTPPTITNLVLVPAAPLANQDITVSYDYSDADGDPEAGTTFAWRVNGTAVALPPAADQRTLTQDRFGMGDRIDVQVTPRDGTAAGTPVDLNPSVTIARRVLTLVPLGNVGVQGVRHKVTATLTDGNGSPVAGELVAFSSPNATVVDRNVLTDAAGKAVSQVTIGTGNTQVDASSGGATATTTIFGRGTGTTSLEVQTAQVTADQQATLLVVARDSATSLPISGMAVVSSLLSGTATPNTATAITDGTGTARLVHQFSLGAHQMQFATGDAVRQVTINSVAGAVARSRSTVLLSAERVAGDGVATVNLTVALKDANGNPVAGVPGSSFRISSTPDAGLTATFDSTDAGGTSRGVLTATRAGDTTITVGVVDPVNNQLTTLTDTLALRVLNVFALHLQPGLNLVGTPVQLDQPAATTVWRGLNPLKVATYLPQSNTYRVLNPIAPGSEFDVLPGRAFWVRVVDSKTVTLSGEPRAGTTYTVPMSGHEWTLASIPTVNAVGWDHDILQVSVNDQVIGNLANSREFIAPYGWLWNAGRQQAELVLDSRLGVGNTTAVIPAGSGFWLHRGTSTSTSGTVGLVFDLQQLARARSRAAAPSAAGWALKLLAGPLTGSASEVTVGVSRQLGRQLDIARPPVPEGQVAVEIVEPATGRSLGGQLDPTPVTGKRDWRLRVTAPVNGEPIQLSWPAANRVLPTGYRAVLTDLSTGQSVSLRGRASVTYTPSGDGSREYKLTVERQLGERLAVGLSASPGRGRGFGLTVTLNQPASLQVVVTGLGGRVVDSWTVGELAAGVSSVTWDGLDAAGRRVPAGTYRIEVRAQDDLGDSAVAAAMVSLR